MKPIERTSSTYVAQSPTFNTNYVDKNLIKRHKMQTDEFNRGRNFAETYINSPGFKQRLNRMLNRNPNVEVTRSNVPLAKTFRTNAGNPSQNIYSHSKDKNEILTASNPKYDYRHSIFHEFGHGVDFMFNATLNGKPIRYSSLYPQLHQMNKETQSRIGKMTDEERKNFYRQNSRDTVVNDIGGEEYWKYHDILPGENYADLFDFRQQLQEAGIYDSTKANNPFTQEHLNKARQLIKNNYRIGSARFLKQYNDNNIINIMNTVAYNDRQSDENQPVYAKQGIKIDNRTSKLIPKHQSKSPVKRFGATSPNAQEEALKKRQRKLKEVGYYTGKIDGIWGKKSKAAQAAYDRDNGKRNETIFQTVRRGLQNARNMLSTQISNKKKQPADTKKEVPFIFRLAQSLQSSESPGISTTLTSSNRKPTLEQFLEMKRQEVRDQAALVNSQIITPNFPVLGTGPMKNHDMDVRGKKGWNDERIRKEFTKYAEKTQKYLDEHPNLEPLARQRIQETLNYYNKVKENPSYIDKHGGGFGCITTASGAYGNSNVRWNNKQFANEILSGKDTGFAIVEPGDYRKGDIIQLGRSEEGNYPHHAEMVTDTFLGYPKLAQTQAEGYGLNDKENDWNNYANLWLRSLYEKHKGLQVVRFVGTKSQNEKWKREYEQLYGKIK